MSKAFYRVANPTMTALLRSPLHGLLSKSLMLLIYEGRKSGKRFIIPVGYVRHNDRIYVFTHSAWYKNFIGGAPMAMRRRGELVRGTATVIDDPAKIYQVVQQIVADRGDTMTERMGLTSATPMHAPAGVKFIEIVPERRG
jgi:hypothetical protein